MLSGVVSVLVTTQSASTLI
uniref:Uncharacterized protein n=1 Tax=Arundo donax TaxID=35708 RepID=A0A0A8ZKK6_ARUDO